MILRYAIIAMLCLGIVSGYTLPGSTIKGNLDMYGNKVLNSTTPVNDTDLATKAYVDLGVGGSYLPLTGGNLTGGVNFGGYVPFNISEPINSTDAVSKNYTDYKFWNVQSPSNDTDAATKKYVDDNAGGDVETSDLWTKVNKSGDTMSGELAMGTNKITGLADGVADTDAATVGQLSSATPMLPSVVVYCNATNIIAVAANGTTIITDTFDGDDSDVFRSISADMNATDSYGLIYVRNSSHEIQLDSNTWFSPGVHLKGENTWFDLTGNTGNTFTWDGSQAASGYIGDNRPTVSSFYVHGTYDNDNTRFLDFKFLSHGCRVSDIRYERVNNVVRITGNMYDCVVESVAGFKIKGNMVELVSDATLGGPNGAKIVNCDLSNNGDPYTGQGNGVRIDGSSTQRIYGVVVRGCWLECMDYGIFADYAEYTASDNTIIADSTGNDTIGIYSSYCQLSSYIGNRIDCQAGTSYGINIVNEGDQSIEGGSIHVNGATGKGFVGAGAAPRITISGTTFLLDVDGSIGIDGAGNNCTFTGLSFMGHTSTYGIAFNGCDDGSLVVGCNFYNLDKIILSANSDFWIVRGCIAGATTTVSLELGTNPSVADNIGISGAV